MKKMFLAFIASCLVFFTVIFTISAFTSREEHKYKVAMSTDFADVDDNSFNQQTFEGCKQWCDSHDIPFSYFKPASNSDAEREKSVELAIERGYNIIYLPGFSYTTAIMKFASKYPDVSFIGIDICKDDFPPDYKVDDNVFCFSYYEEVAGYLAGYAAVAEGYTKHGFLGGMAVASVTRFGYGYAQGLSAAATELNVEEDIELKFVYGGQFYGDSEITKYVDNWYKSGTEVIFTCGGSIYTSSALAAKVNNKKVIGVDTDQSLIINKDYGEGICITSAMKGIAATCKMSLQLMSEGYIDQSSFAKLGLLSSTNLEDNFVGLPIDTWSMKDFAIEDYRNIVQEFLDGKRKASSDISEVPELPKVNIIQLGSIK